MLVAMGVQLPRRGPVAVHESVPIVRVPRATAPRSIDGHLDTTEWQGAVSAGLFVDNLTGADNHGSTLARLLWDDDALYVAFEAEDNDPWVRLGAPGSARLRHGES
jgi:hypothetical protein